MSTDGEDVPDAEGAEATPSPAVPSADRARKRLRRLHATGHHSSLVASASTENLAAWSRRIVDRPVRTARIVAHCAELQNSLCFLARQWAPPSWALCIGPLPPFPTMSS